MGYTDYYSDRILPSESVIGRATGPLSCSFLSCLSVCNVGVLWPNDMWIKMPLGTEVGLGPCDVVLDGNPAPPTERGTARPTFRPMSTVAKRSPISETAELLFVVVLFFIRPHRGTTYVDAIYCYRPSGVVCRSVRRSVSLVSPAKTAEPIEMRFELRILVAQGILY